MVDKDGSVREPRVAKSVDDGLDQMAIQAVKQWTFKPGEKEGVPVPVIATVQVNFRLLPTPAQPVSPEKLSAAAEVLEAQNADWAAQAIVNQLRLLLQQQLDASFDQQMPKAFDRNLIAADLQQLKKNELVRRFTADLWLVTKRSRHKRTRRHSRWRNFAISRLCTKRRSVK